MPPARDYRWNLIRNRSTPDAPVAPVPPVSPVTGAPAHQSQESRRLTQPPTMGRYQGTGPQPTTQRQSTFARCPGGEPRNTKTERQPVLQKKVPLKKPKIEEGSTFPSSFPPVQDQIGPPPLVREPSPPVHGVIPIGRTTSPNVHGDDRVTHPVLRMPEVEGNQGREVLLPYTQTGADGVATCRRRPRQLTPGETSRS